MTINDFSISLCIKSICRHYLAAENNYGFRLYVEDKPQPGLSAAGQMTERKEVSDDYVQKMLKNKIKSIGDILAVSNDEIKLCGATFCRERIIALMGGVDGEDWVHDSVTFYYNNIIELAIDYLHLDMLCWAFVRHELRHAEQFTYLRQMGIDPNVAMNNENQTLYGEGPLERDAYAVQNGEDIPIEEAMACFLK